MPLLHADTSAIVGAYSPMSRTTKPSAGCSCPATIRW
jgi:hypothetical protein